VRSIFELSFAELQEWFRGHGHPAYRAAQVTRWLFARRAGHWEEMTDLGKPLRRQLASEFQLWTTEIAGHTRARDGTEKMLLELDDGGRIECVLLRDRIRRTLCISTQVGCGMGCVFCASGLEGLQRNLTAGEMVEQMLRLQRLLRADERVTHIVVMGMGEPLANIDALLAALETASGPAGLGISPRRITISTVGMPKVIRRLSVENARYRLAISLHAASDPVRARIVPTSRAVGLTAILAAADEYYQASGRRLTFEYVLLAGINDGRGHAEQLAELLAPRRALVNVIPYNPVPGLPYRAPSPQVQSQFRAVLEQSGLRVKIRHRKGDKINAACGQLRRR